MTSPPNTPANWFADPTGRHQHRYWDGSAWTDHVSDHGITGHDPISSAVLPTDMAPTDTAVTLTGAFDNVTSERIREQVAGGGLRGAGLDTNAVGQGLGTIFTEPVLVVNQKAKLIEVTNQYAVFDRNGTQLGYVTEVGQSAVKKVMRVLSSLDQFMTHRLEVRDMTGGVLLQITRPAKVFKSTVVVSDGPGAEIGRIVQENMVGKIHFGLEAGGQRLGSIHAENWRAWNFRIEDAAGAEIARITKTFEGVLRTAFTTADNYVVQLHVQLPQPLLSLVVASALSVDTALKQDSRGLG
ncbi:MAG: phospholipid scramblase-related protein [Acidimicrobiales bacterium]